MIVAKKAPMSSADILLNNNIKLNVVAETFEYLGVTIGSRPNWDHSQLKEFHHK